MITRDQVQARLERLRRERDQALANVNAYAGAIQDCEHWLKVLDAAEPTPDREAPPVVELAAHR